MPRRRKTIPSYTHHKPSDRAYVRLADGVGGRRIVYLGKYDSPDSRAEYARIIAELAVAPAVPPASHSPTVPPTTVNEVLVAFLRHAQTHYRRPDGAPSSELDELRRSLGPVRRLYGHTPARDFGPLALAAVRGDMIRAGWCRTLVNRRVERVKRVFKWAGSQELVPPTVYHGLLTLAGLQRGRTEARESDPVRPVDPALVAATLPRLSRHVRAMVELMRLTGMRPGEACRFRFADVERPAGAVWLYRPPAHKTAHRGKARVVALGPQARALLVAFLTDGTPPPVGFDALDPRDPAARAVAAAHERAGRAGDASVLRDPGKGVVVVGGCVVDPDARVFSPARERAERFRRLRAARKSKVQPSQIARRKENPARRPGDGYRTHAVAAAVWRACGKVGAAGWHPNQLRHTFATEVRRRHGVEAAQVLLGHAKADVTQVYAERNLSLAVKVAAEMG